MAGSKAGHFSKISRGLFVRVIFALHSFLYTWRVVHVTESYFFWALFGVQILMIIEAIVTLKFHHSKEWKWFTPCIFLYICNVVPCVWLLELNSLESRVDFLKRYNLESCTPPQSNETAWLSLYNVGIPVTLTDEAWSLALQQLLLFLLIVGRWILPRHLSHEKLSNLLLVNIGMAADIVEFLSEGNLEGANCNETVTILILSIWTISVLQFPFHGDGEEFRRTSLGSTLARNQKLMSFSWFSRIFSFEIWSILAIVFMQDGPFLAMRVYLIYLYGVSDQTLLFFASKNFLLLMLQLYRITALLCLEKDDYGRDSFMLSKKIRRLRTTMRNLGVIDTDGQDGRDGVDVENRRDDVTENGNTLNINPSFQVDDSGGDGERKTQDFQGANEHVELHENEHFDDNGHDADDEDKIADESDIQLT